MESSSSKVKHFPLILLPLKRVPIVLLYTLFLTNSVTQGRKQEVIQDNQINTSIEETVREDISENTSETDKDGVENAERDMPTEQMMSVDTEAPEPENFIDNFHLNLSPEPSHSSHSIPARQYKSFDADLKQRFLEPTESYSAPLCTDSKQMGNPILGKAALESLMPSQPIGTEVIDKFFAALEIVA